MKRTVYGVVRIIEFQWGDKITMLLNAHDHPTAAQEMMEGSDADYRNALSLQTFDPSTNHGTGLSVMQLLGDIGITGISHEIRRMIVHTGGLHLVEDTDGPARG